MSKSRIIQGLILLTVFIIAVLTFSGGDSAPTEDNSGYLPPSP